MFINIAKIVYILLVIVGFTQTAGKGRVKGFVVWIILSLIGAAILLSLSCDDIVWIGKIPICR